MDTSHISRNEADRQRLRDLVARLTADDVERSLGDDWTVKAALAHMAFWDRYALVLIDQWEEHGFREPAFDSGHVNPAALRDWLALAPEYVLREVISAADAVDRRIAQLNPELAAAVVAGGRQRVIDRSVHRGEHLDQVERAITG